MPEVPAEHCLTRERVDPLVLNYAGSLARPAWLPNGRVTVVAIVGLVVVACGMLVVAAIVRHTPSPRPLLASTGPSRVPVIAKQIHAFRYDMGRLPTDLEELFTSPRGAEAARRWMGPYLESREALIAPDDSRVRYHLYRSTDDGELHFRVTVGSSIRTHQLIDDCKGRYAR